jgi:putative cardiolipin synthase
MSQSLEFRQNAERQVHASDDLGMLNVGRQTNDNAVHDRDLSAQQAIRVQREICRRPSRLTVLLLLTALPSCAYLPHAGSSAPTFAFDRPGETEAGARVALEAALHPGDSALYVLGNGLDAFAARVAVIDGAEQAIDAQYYIFRDDVTGSVLLQRMLMAADRGVRVRLLIDDLGSDGIDDVLAAANVHPNLEVRLFNPRARGPWNWLAKTLDTMARPFRINHRMHNKMLSGDGLVGVVGGRNVGDEYFDAAEGVNFGDLDLLAAGPVAAELGDAFDLFWNCEYTKLLDGWSPFERDDGDLSKLRATLKNRLDEAIESAYAERLKGTGFVQEMTRGELPVIWARTHALSDLPRKIVASGDEIEDTLLITRLGESMPLAQEALLIVSPYFIPREAGVEYLTTAVERGARVRILTNSLAATDVPAVHAGYKKYRRALLEGGVELYELKPTSDSMLDGYRKGILGSKSASLHAKTFIIDGEYVFVGSLNLDPRSVDLNTELGLVVESKELAAVLTSGIEDALLPTASWRLTLDDGDLVWSGVKGGESVELRTDPDTTSWTRFTVWCLGLLPIEGQL